MSDNTTVEMMDMQARVLQRIQEFSIENPTIEEAVAVMNMTMPDYLLALDTIRGGNVVSASASVEFPLFLNA